MAQRKDAKQAEEHEDKPVEVDPRPHWIPFVFIIGIAVPLLVLLVLGAIVFR